MKLHSNVNNEGMIDIENFKNLITEKTKLISIMLANNEIGSVQDIRSLVQIVRKKRKNLVPKYIFILMLFKNRKN